MPVGLTLVSLIISGCSQWRQVDLAQLRQSQAVTAEKAARQVKVSSQSIQAKSPHATTVAERVETPGTVDQPTEMKPWPKIGTPEWQQLRAEQIEQDRRVKDAINNICRGC